MNVQLVRYVFERARMECALGPRVARALGVPAKAAAQLAFVRPDHESLRTHHEMGIEATFLHGVVPELRPFRHRFGVAVGKAAEAMALGAGAMTAGLCVTNTASAALPDGWQHVASSHPDPDERSLDAADRVRSLVDNATDEDVVVVLISGGASAMLEAPRIPVDELRGIAGALMSAGAPIEELNTVRSALSTIKGGQLALDCGARIVTLVASDIIGDRIELVGSGPTIGPWLDDPHAPADFGAVAEARRAAAIEILERHGLAVPIVLHEAIAARVVTRGDRVQLVSRMRDFADAFARGLRHEGVDVAVVDDPMRGDVGAIADRLAATTSPTLMWGEPTMRVPAEHGEGGRMQQLALELARRIAGTDRTAVALGTDGMDGPQPAERTWPAGAFVDGSTWDNIVEAGVDPARALARCDAGTVLAIVGDLVLTGPTNINHADVVVIR